jgi:hypothetical protein
MLLAGCAAEERANARGARIVQLHGRAMLEIPAGEFEDVHLPTFFVEIEPGPPADGLPEATDLELSRAVRRWAGSCARAGGRGGSAIRSPPRHGRGRRRTPRGSDDTAPVGSFPRGASPYGVMDMAGNVYERVVGRRGPGTIRSGAFVCPMGWQMRASDRCGYRPDRSHASVGFRCVSDRPPDQR